MTNRAGGRPAADNLRGAVWMMVGMSGYVINDAFIKLAAEEMPLFQAIYIRGTLISAGLLGWVLARRMPLSSLGDRLVLARIVLETLATIAYLSALVRLPLAGLTAVMQVVPLAVTFAAARLLRESVDARRVVAVVVGFVGVLAVVQPWSDGFSPWFGLGLVAVALVTVRDLVTSGLSEEIPTAVVALGTSVSIAAMAVVVTMVEGWRQPGGRPLGLLALAALFLAVGYVASVVTVRVGDLSFSAPFRYTVLVFAVVLQIVFFDEIPDTLTFVGMAIIAGAGLWTVRGARAA